MKKQPNHLRFAWQYKWIGFLQSLKIPGSSFLAKCMAKWFLPNPNRLGEVCIEFSPNLRFWINPADRLSGAKDLFRFGTLQPETLNFIKEQVHEGATFFDCGAGFGWFSLFANSCIGLSGKIWSFESNPSVFRLLERNIDFHSTGRLFSFPVTLKSAETHKSLTLDSVVRQFNLHPDGIRIAANQDRLGILNGAKESIEKYRPFLIVEFSDRDHQKVQIEIYERIVAFQSYTLFKLATKKKAQHRIEIKTVDEIDQNDILYCLSQ